MSEPRSVLNSMLAAAHLIVPDELPALVNDHADGVGAESAVIFVVDLDQRVLVAVPASGQPGPDPLDVDGTPAGQSFRSVEIIEEPGDGATVVWVPALDGTERLGVLRFEFKGAIAPEEDLKAFASLVAELIMGKDAYGDVFHVARRRQSMTIGAELLWQLLPPLTFGCENLVITAGFVPTDRLGGDAFDYGVDSNQAQVVLLDAVGHDLQAGLVATAAVAAFRNARRMDMEIESTAAHIGSAIADNFNDFMFLTGVVASLEIATGRFSWCVAGHPAPLLLRSSRVVKDLDVVRGQPFGIGPASPVVSEQLEPGDRILLYTDGVTEARNANGELLGLETLIELVASTPVSVPPPETMRLLMHAVEEYNHGQLRDDATVVLIEWRGPGSRLLRM